MTGIIPQIWWLPLVSVLLGGLLTTVSGLLLEIFRDRSRRTFEIASRRRGALAELERALIDAHSKMISIAPVAGLLSGTRDNAEGSPSNEILIKALTENSGRVELLRAISLAARVGTPEIRSILAEYSMAQVAFAESPTGREPRGTMERLMPVLLEQIATELKNLDEKV